MPFLYNYADQPWKTEQFVREVQDSMYHDAPFGLENNEDYGQMSAWYVLSSMGFYSFCPGKPEYVLCSPVFDKVAIHLDNSKTFTISAQNNSSANQYIQKATINGKPQTSFILNHNTILAGGELRFEMGDMPNKKLWTKP
jgi:putative alpha-1,2-mannosidase